MVQESFCYQKEKEKHIEKPLFIWLHYYDPHSPYFGRKEITFKNKLPLLPGQQETNLENYDREIRFTDQAIKELFAFLESEKNERGPAS